jgi:hypothetical protein
MITGWRFVRSTGIMFLCIASLQMAYATGENHQKKKVQPHLPALPYGPTGAIQPIPLDSMAPVAPQVTYQKGLLTIVAANSTLEDILSAVREQTGAQIEVPDVRERMVTHLGPGPAQKIVAELLNGSAFNYVLLGSAEDPRVLTRVVLLARSASEASTAAPSQPTTAVNVQAKPGDSTAVKNARAESNGRTPGQPDHPTAEQQLGMTPLGLLVPEVQQGEGPQQQQSPGQWANADPVFSVPEIDGSTGLAALALVISAILIIRGRRGG